MSGEPTITIIGNLAADPELRYTQSGKPVANITIASTPRTYNKQTSQYEDGTTLWVRGSLWDGYAENAAETLRKGMQVIAQGELTQRDWTDKDGNKRSSIEMRIREIGPTLRFGTAQVQRKTGGGGRQQATQAAQQAAYNAPRGGSSEDPWAVSGQPAWNQGEAPF